MSVTIYGASDNLIKIDGDVDDKFTLAAGSEDDTVLAISEGTVLRIKLDDHGVWRTNPVCRGRGRLSIKQAPREGDEDNYSDRATVYGMITWVVLGSSVAAAAAVAR